MTDHSAGRGKGDGTFTYKTLLVAGMHFMDVYNYDINRVKRCVIHYTAPNGLVYPFCTYNSGPCFREKIEKQYSVPLDLKTGKPTADGTTGLVEHQLGPGRFPARRFLGDLTAGGAGASRNRGAASAPVGEGGVRGKKAVRAT